MWKLKQKFRGFRPRVDSGSPSSAHRRFPCRRKSGLLDDILVCVFSPPPGELSLSPYHWENRPSYSRIFFLDPRSAVTFSLAVPSVISLSLSLFPTVSPSLILASLSFSLSTGKPETFPRIPLRRHSHLLYSPTAIRIPVACYIMAYQLFCQFPVRAPDEWDFFLVLLLLCVPARRWNYRPNPRGLVDVYSTIPRRGWYKNNNTALLSSRRISESVKTANVYFISFSASVSSSLNILEYFAQSYFDKLC